MTTTFIISFFPKLPNLTALSLLSHLPLIKHLPDPFLLLCRQCNSFHSSLLNEMGKHTRTWGVCVERGISAVFQEQGMQVAGTCSLSIYTLTVQPLAPFAQKCVLLWLTELPCVSI